MDRLTVPGTMPTLVADLTCAVNGSYTENYIRALCGRAAEALQSLSQEAVRDEALEEAARVVWVDGEKPSETWTDSQTGEPAFDPIQVSRMNIAFAIRALKREPNAAGQAEVESEKSDVSAKPAPAAPDVAKAVEEIRFHARQRLNGGGRVPSIAELEEWAALLARLGQGWVPSARFSWGPGGMVADPKGGYVWVDIPKLCADCLQPEYCGRNGCIQPTPGASDE